MLEINKEQLMSFNEINRVRILKMIAQGAIKYVADNTNAYVSKYILEA